MSKTIVEILLDYSGSMGFMKGHKQEGEYLIDGHTRLFLLKKMVIEEIVPTLDYSSEIYIRTFRTALTIRNGIEQYAENRIVPIFEGKFNKEKITTEIEKLTDPPLGGTPISAALEESFKNLEKFSGCDRKIILITDGEENTGGNYLETAKKFHDINGFSCQIFIVGLAQDKKSQEAAREIATGGYYNLDSKDFNRNQVKQALSALKIAVLNDTIEQQKLDKEFIHNSDESIVVERKIEEIKTSMHERSVDDFNLFEQKIKDFLSLGNSLSQEFSDLKERLRVQSLLDGNSVHSTTLTIDADYSEEIRSKSESYLFKILCGQYGSDKVKWLNEIKESYEPYDFIIYDDNKVILEYVECKGTVAQKPTFYLTNGEWDFFLKNKTNYRVYRVSNLNNSPSHNLISNLFESLLDGSVVPYLLKPEVLKEKRVFLTLLNTD